MRHADVAYFDEAGRPHRPDGVHLTPRGHAQTEAAARMLAAVPFDLAVTSGLPRTEQTARAILAGREVRLEAEPRFREIATGRMSEWGDVDPSRVRQALLDCLGPGLTPGSTFLKGESFGACAERVVAGWDDLVARADWRNVLVVAHGVVNRLLLGYLLGMELDALARLEQDACCINLVEVDVRGMPLVRLINHTPEDPAKIHLTMSTLEGLYQQYLGGKTE